MPSLVVLFLSICMTFVTLYLVATHGCRLFGAEIRWFDGLPGIGLRARLALVSSLLALATSGALILVALLLTPEKKPTNHVLVVPGSSAARAGIRDGDEILQIGELGIRTFDDVREQVLTSEGPLTLHLRRGAETITVQAIPEEHRLGVRSVMRERRRSLSEALSTAWTLCTQGVVNAVRPPQGHVQLQGPMALARAANAREGEPPYLLVWSMMLGQAWMLVPLVHVFDLGTLAVHRQRRQVQEHSRDALNLGALGAAILLLGGASFALGMPTRAPGSSSALTSLTTGCGLALSLASFTALRRRLPLVRAASLAILGAFVGPVLWIGTFIWLRYLGTKNEP